MVHNADPSTDNLTYPLLLSQKLQAMNVRDQ